MKTRLPIFNHYGLDGSNNLNVRDSRDLAVGGKILKITFFYTVLVEKIVSLEGRKDF